MKTRCLLLLTSLLIVTALPTIAQTNDALIQPDDLVYLGAFRLPDDGGEGVGWVFAGHALAYTPDGDPASPDDGAPGSLFGVGHDWTQYVSEISIPAPVISISKNPADLNMATTLQDFTDIRGDLFDYLEMPRAALAYLPAQGDQATGKLYFAWGQHQEEMADDPAHGWVELDLANPQVAGLWSVGGLRHYLTTDYLFPVAPEWDKANAPGQLLATGRFREGAQSASGPALFAISPWNEGNPPAPGTDIPALTLLHYGDYQAPDEQKLNDYHHADDWSGGAWLTTGDRSAVVFVGTKGIGDDWYGFANGVIWPDEAPYPDVPPAPNDLRGFWSSSYQAQFIFYDPADLAAVARGELDPWQPQPYATLTVDEVLFGVDVTPDGRGMVGAQKSGRLGAAAFDRANGLLYVFEPTATEDSESIIHVWRVGG
jgi:hypothetical protein